MTLLPELPLASRYKFGVDEELRISVPSGSVNDLKATGLLLSRKMDSKNEIPFPGITKEPERPSLPAVCVMSETEKFGSLLPEELLFFFAQLTVRKIADSMRTNPLRILSALMRIKFLFPFNLSMENTTYRADNNFCDVSLFSITINPTDAKSNAFKEGQWYVLTNVSFDFLPEKLFDSFRHFYSVASKILNYY